MYGPEMGRAELTNGAKAFFRQAGRNDSQLFIVSHKTESAKYDKTRTNLRHSAMAWMTRKGFFDINGLNMSKQNVYFETTRQEKLARIHQLGCTHFIDDLEEVFQEQDFPDNVEKILYDPSASDSNLSSIVIATTWTEISQLIFGTYDASSD